MAGKKPADDLFEQSSMSFGDHLEELRRALLKAFVWLGIGTMVGLFFAEDIVLYLQRPLENAMYEFRVKQAKDAFKQANGVDAPPELAALLSELGVTPQISYVDPAVFQDSYDHGNLKKAAKRDSATLQTSDSADKPAPSSKQSAVEPDSKTGSAVAKPAQEAESPDLGSAKESESEESAAPNDDESKTVPDDVEPAGSTASMGFADEAVGDDAVGDDAAKEAQLEAKKTASMLEELANPWKDLNAKSLKRLRPVIIWQPNETRLVSLQATEGFMIWLKAGLVAGVVIGSPGIFWHIWQFFAAGLYPHERRYVYWYLPMSLGLFFAGVALAFFVMLKIVLGFLTGYTTGLGVDFTPRLTDYVSFALFLPLGFGIAFQLPLVMLGLHRFGVISVELFISQWRIAILAIAFLSMILTPSDPYTMVGLAAPLSVLYFFGIFLCKYMPRGDGFGSQALDPTN